MAKAEKTKLPKEIGGFKLAKTFRKSEPIEELMSTPEGRALLSEAVTTGLSAALDVLRRSPGPHSEPGDEPQASRAAATAMAAEGLEAVLTAWTEHFGSAAAPEEPAPRAAKTPRRRATSGTTPAPARRRARPAAKPSVDEPAA